MSSFSSNLINTGLQPGAGHHPVISTASAVLPGCKPLKRFSCPSARKITRLKPGVNESSQRNATRHQILMRFP